VVDLPGTYSLSAFSIEEIIARDFIIKENPDVVVAVLDSTNLERNLYLAVQILELGAKLIVALNMTDLAEANGIKIDMGKMSSALQASIVKTIANRSMGISELKDAILDCMDQEER
jgi:Fe2+ transport system protein B